MARPASPPGVLVLTGCSGLCRFQRRPAARGVLCLQAQQRPTLEGLSGMRWEPRERSQVLHHQQWQPEDWKELRPQGWGASLLVEGLEPSGKAVRAEDGSFHAQGLFSGSLGRLKSGEQFTGSPVPGSRLWCSSWVADDGPPANFFCGFSLWISHAAPPACGSIPDRTPSSWQTMRDTRRRGGLPHRDDTWDTVHESPMN